MHITEPAYAGGALDKPQQHTSRVRQDVSPAAAVSLSYSAEAVVAVPMAGTQSKQASTALDISDAACVAAHTKYAPQGMSTTPSLCHSLVPKTRYLIAGGYEVGFCEETGGWVAHVQDAKGRVQVLPVLCAPDQTPRQAIEALASKAIERYKYCIHLLKAHQPPWPLRVVYVGNLGLHDGGNSAYDARACDNIAEGNNSDACVDAHGLYRKAVDHCNNDVHWVESEAALPTSATNDIRTATEHSYRCAAGDYQGNSLYPNALQDRAAQSLHKQWQEKRKKVQEEYEKARQEKSLMEAEGNEELPPLHKAVREGDHTITKFLLNCVIDVNAKDRWGLTPLHWVARGGHQTIASMLLDRGAEVNVKDRWHQTPLHWAAEKGHRAVLSLLLDHHAMVKGQDLWKQTPLHWAAAKNYQTIVSILLNHGANIAAWNGAGNTPLYEAVLAGHHATVALLLDCGADVAVRKTSDMSGNSVLHCAVSRGHTDVTSILLDRGAQVDTRNYWNQTPLHWAARQGHRATVTLLLNHGAAVDAQDDAGSTPLHEAAYSGWSTTVKMLLDRGATVNAQDHAGSTPLHKAAQAISSLDSAGPQDVVVLLLDRGADIEAQDKEGLSPLERASEDGHQFIMQLLSR
ncbi:MAG: ankyrin repeat domain-containing protein [Bacteroidota bacterium]